MASFSLGEDGMRDVLLNEILRDDTFTLADISLACNDPWLLWLNPVAIGRPLTRILSMTCKQAHALLARPCIGRTHDPEAIRRAWYYWMAGHGGRISNEPPPRPRSPDWKEGRSSLEIAVGALIHYGRHEALRRGLEPVNGWLAAAPSIDASVRGYALLHNIVDLPLPDAPFDAQHWMAAAVRFAHSRVILAECIERCGKFTRTEMYELLTAACDNGRADVLETVLAVADRAHQAGEMESIVVGTDEWERLAASYACEKESLVLLAQRSTPTFTFLVDPVRMRPIMCAWLDEYTQREDKDASPSHVKRAIVVAALHVCVTQPLLDRFFLMLPHMTGWHEWDWMPPIGAFPAQSLPMLHLLEPPLVRRHIRDWAFRTAHTAPDATTLEFIIANQDRVLPQEELRAIATNFIRLHGGRPPLDGAAVRLGPVLRRFDHVPDDILAYISLK